MRKFIVVSLCLFIATIFSISSVETVQAANSYYESIDIHVTLNEDGSADFVERWKAHLYKGTENYVVKQNLGKATIENFTVTEDGKQFEFVKNWDINASQNEKAFKNGIINKRNGIEMSWGIGEYGTHEYVLEYTVKNIIQQLDDSQVLYWGFSNAGINIPRSNITVEVIAPKALSEVEERIWAFGYDGDIEFEQGSILAKSYSQLKESQYVVLLIKFADGTFTTENRVKKDFEALQKQAFKGSDYDLDAVESVDEGGFFIKAFNFIKSIFSVVIFFGIFVVVLIFSQKFNQQNSLEGKRRKFTRRYKEEYYRDYPYEDNYLHTYYVTYIMGLSEFNTLLTASLLKLINDDKIRMDETVTGVLRRKHQTIHILNSDVDSNTSEGRLFHMIRGLADSEGMITDRQISKWAERNYRSLASWEKDIVNESKQVLTNKNYLDKTENNILFFTRTNYELTEDGKKMEENIYKYVNYLYDFSLLNEHEAINVKLWDEVMIWAAYLNLTSVVMKQFAKLYPNYEQETKYRNNSLRRSTYFATAVTRGRTKSEKREQERRSSGGGGTASSGGGGGAAGGGSGGGVR